ncbi:MAG TPA: metal ABC transporter permease [Acholeplasma sp.]|nr:metal ABC transporter permease [Acholeplasma sp.]
MIELQMLSVAIFVSLSCSLLGVFLVLRKMSMQIDAISHTVLLGIVVAFMIVLDLNSPLLIFGATLMGVITVFLTEVFIKAKKTDEESAVGVVFPLLFSIAVIIITLYFGGVHLDVDSVLLGKLEFSIFEQVEVFGVEIGPTMLYIMMLVFIMNAIFIKVFFKELKIVSFDYALAASLGFMPAIIHYLLMAFISLTAVTAFNAVGSVLVIALMIGPAATALLLTKELKHTLLASGIIGFVNSVLGFFIAIGPFKGEVTISGMIATQTLITFLLVLVFSPYRGIITTLVKRHNQKLDFAFTILVLHIGTHEKEFGEEHEILRSNIHYELKWSQKKFDYQLQQGLNKNIFLIKNDEIHLTKEGWNYYKSKKRELS